MDILAQFKGQNGKIIIYEDHLVISQNTLGGFMAHGGYTGDRTYFYKDIISIEYKRPNFIANGYFKIIAQGTADTDATVGLLGSSLSSAADHNTIVLRAFTKSVGDETDRVYALLMQKFTAAKQGSPVNAPAASPVDNKLDDLKKLGDLKASGVLTEEEFQAQKQKILNG